MANMVDMLTRLNGTTFYHGETKDGYPKGSGEYVFANGTVYKGKFYEGMFDGDGTLEFPAGGKYVATWKLGKLVKGTYYYADALEYAERGWQYCSDSDRRFWTEQQAASLAQLTPSLSSPNQIGGIALAAPDRTYTELASPDGAGAAGSGVVSLSGGGPQLSDRVPAPVIPVGSYDVGDGYYRPSDGKIYSYEGKFLRLSSGAEADWALKKCRVGLASEQPTPPATAAAAATTNDATAAAAKK